MSNDKNIKNHFVCVAPFRTATVYEDIKTETISVELTEMGESKEVIMLGAGSRNLTRARQTGLSWTRHGVSDPTHSSPNPN